MEKLRKKTILLILPHTGGGGDTQVLYNLLYELGTPPFTLHILSAQRGSLHEDFGRFGRLYTFPIDDTSLPRRILRRFFLPLYQGLKRSYAQYLIQKINPDVVYVNTVNENEFSQSATRFAKKLVVHMHEMGFVVTQRMRAAWIEELLTKAHTIISPARAVSDFYRDVFGVEESKMHVVHGTVSDRRLRQQQSGPGFRDIAGWPEGTLVVGSVGSIIYRKGIDTFLRACSLLKEKVPHQRFQFVWLGGQPGKGATTPYRQALQKSIERAGLADAFRFLPYAGEVGNFYAQLDIFVLPSRMEAFPLVVLEALLAQKPVVAMDVAGVREVIDEATGYLVKDRTPEGLAEGILHFMESENRRLETGQRGRQRVLAQFEATVQAPKWLKILEDI